MIQVGDSMIKEIMGGFHHPGEHDCKPTLNWCHFNLLSVPSVDGEENRTPPFMTKRTFRRALISRVGSPSTATRSAKSPGLIVPSRLSRPRTLALTDVAERKASIGFMPNSRSRR